MDDNSEDLHRQLTPFRKQKGWTQEEFAEILDVDRTYVSTMERGMRNPSIDVVAKIADKLEIEPYQLLKPSR